MGIQLWRGYRNGPSDPRLARAAGEMRERVALQSAADTAPRGRAAHSDRCRELARPMETLTRRRSTAAPREFDTASVEVTRAASRGASLRLGIAVAAASVTHRLLGRGRLLWEQHPTATAMGGAYAIGIGIPLMRQPEALQPMTAVWGGISLLALALHWSPTFARYFERWFLARPDQWPTTSPPSASSSSTTSETERPSVSI